MRRTVVYAGTRNLYRIMKTAVRSLLANNNIDDVYLLIEDDIFPYELDSRVKTMNISDQTFFPETGANSKSRWSYMAMIRVALSKLFPDLDRVLWLDCDTIVNGDISELFEIDMKGYCFAGVPETVKTTDRFVYLNSGVLLMNLDFIRETKQDDRLIKHLNSYPLELPDQDAINQLSQNFILTLDSKYNACRFTAECTDPLIYHFAGFQVFDNDPVFKKYADKDERTLRTLIAVPTMGDTCVDFTEGLLNIEKPAGTVYTFVKNTLIYNARNFILDNAIHYGFDRVFWLDSDVVVKPDALVRLTDEMNRTGADFISGLYFTRSLPTKPVIYNKLWWNVKDGGWVDTGRTHFENYPEGLFEIAGAGFGCVLTSIELLKKLKDAYGAPFTPLMGISEDLAFCWRASREGFKLFCDSRVKCGHVGTIIFDESMYKGGGLK